MKTIVNKLRFALLLGFIAIGMTALAQSIPNGEKMSVSTLMFLDEMAGKINFDEPTTTIKAGQPALVPAPTTAPRRPIATPDTIDGQVYISAFVRVTADEVIGELKATGVQVMCTFDNGLLTALIPIDKVEEIAALEGVTRIEVGEQLCEETNLARQASNVDDVLTLSQDAALAGLQQKYDGRGVLLGVIDNGIDFQHIAFKDKDGNPRIKRAYKYDGSSATEYTGSGSLPTADATDTDHGTHTSSIAGGSSVIVSGTDVTVTDDHSQATYGGMAPGADLYLAGISGLTSTYLVNAFQKIVEYADAQGQPVVVSNSWSNSLGPRDGQYNSTVDQVVSQYFGDSHPNRVCLFASANRAGNADSSEGGGLFATGTASSSSPLGSILRYHRYSNADNGYSYNGYILDAWSTSALACKIYVLDSSTGAILTTVTVTQPSSGTSTTVSDLSTYYSGTLTAYWGTNSTNGKRQLYIYASNVVTTSRTYDSSNNYYSSAYTLAIEVYPTSGSSRVDMWAGSSGYFTNFLTTSGHNWVLGTDDCCVSDHALMDEVISVGSYITREGGTSGNSVGDISPFSGYALASVCPAGVGAPWITAPGQLIVSAFNHTYTSRSSTPLVNNANNPYGTAQGTSMATPAAAGVVALWMQAANECGHQLTHSEVKQIMAETAIHDYWTDSGPNATHFGNGKIDALAGIEYILNHYAVPTITASPREVTFEVEPGTSSSQNVTVGGVMLTGDITATLNDANGVFTINSTNLGSGGTLVITYSPNAPGTHSATITLTSTGADPVTITITGTAAVKADATVCDNSDTNQFLPVYGYYYEQAQVNQMLYPSTKFTDKGMDGKKITKIKFYPTTYNNYSGINFYYQASRGNGTVTVKLANMPSGTTGYNRNATRKDADFVTVKTITMPTSAQTDLIEWVFEDLENDFTYTGGDLLIEVTTEAGMYGYTYFAGESQSSYTGYYSYGSTSRGQQFLPKVTFEWEVEFIPVTSGSVSPSELTFTDVRIGRSDNATVTITNSGNQPFTPVIDTTGLPSCFTVTGNGTVDVNGTLDLTVTYTPTDEGPHSGSFTVTIGDQTYTVTVTGNGIIVNSTLTSNEVMVDVYHSDLQPGVGTYIFTEDQVVLDEDMSLTYGDPALSSLQVLVKSDEAITQYDVWTYPEGNSVATATRDGMGYNNGEETFNFIDDATQMWIPMNVNNTGNGTVSYYVPVTIADGVVTTGNTYGAAVVESDYDPVTLNLFIGGSKSDGRWGGHWSQTLSDGTEKDYCVYTPVIFIEAPQLDGITHKPYLLRAWLVADDEVTYYNFDRIDGAIKGTTELEMPYLLGELPVVEGMPGVNFIIGEDWNATTSPVRLQNAFGAPSQGANVTIVVRAYYQRCDQGESYTLRAGGGGGFGFGQGSGSGDNIPTGLDEVSTSREVVSVTYVNSLGMQSSKAFDGVNIVVTRYSDGTFTTTKVVRR